MIERTKRCTLGFGEWTVFLAVVAALFATPATAQQLLLDSTFDQDEEGWTAADADSDLVWSPVESIPVCDPFSGTAFATHGGPAAGSGRNFVPSECVWPVQPSATHRFGAQYLFPTGQDRTGSVRMVVVWTDGPNCGGSVITSSQSSDVTTATAGAWVGQIAETLSPAGAVSASLRVRMQKTEADGSLDLHFDRVFLTEGRAAFFDGFESGSTCRWSNAVF